MKFYEKLFITLLILFISISSKATADTIMEEIEVYFRDITIEVNEEEVLLDTEPFAYNDRIYVPVRFVVDGLDGEISWDNENNKVKIKSYRDFPECDYLEGEMFVYGLVTALDKEKKEITIEQHFDDNSMEVIPSLKIREDVVIILQRNNKMMNLDVGDLRVGEDIGLVLDINSLVRGIIISK